MCVPARKAAAAAALGGHVNRGREPIPSGTLRAPIHVREQGACRVDLQLQSRARTVEGGEPDDGVGHGLAELGRVQDLDFCTES